MDAISLKKDYQNRALLDYLRWNADQVAIENAINKFATSVTDGDSGADHLKMTPIPDIDPALNTVQAVLEQLVTLLKSMTVGASGAHYVNSAAIEGVAGSTIYTQLASLKELIDARYTIEQLNDNTGIYGSNVIGTPPIAGMSGNTVLAQLASLKALLDSKVPSALVSSTAQPDKLILTNEEGQLPVNITGNAATATNATNHIGQGGDAHPAATMATAGFMSGDDKQKLDNIEELAEVNQNAFSYLAVPGFNNIEAGNPMDTFILEAGTGIRITAYPELKKVIFEGTGEVIPGAHAANHMPGGTDIIPDATTTDSGFMSAADKTKLDGIETGANNYSHPATHSADMIVDGTNNKAYTAAEKTKLAGIEDGANNYVLPVAGAALGGVKSGTDITVDVNGNVLVNDDSHNHIISNVDGLQAALDAKLATASYTAADVLSKVKTVDGSGSGLDADLLDGKNAANTSGAIPVSNGTVNTNLNADMVDDIHGTSLAASIFGNGSDGDVTISANTDLTRDMFYNNLTINAGVTLNAKGYRIFVKNTLINNGTIRNNGLNGDGHAGGGRISGYLGGGASGGKGTGQSLGDAAEGSSANPGLGGAGGKGGDGNWRFGEMGGTVIPPSADIFSLIGHALMGGYIKTAPDKATPANIMGGAGGGGGGANFSDPSLGTGGGGGGGGGVVFIAAKTISTVGTIQAIGGNGASGTFYYSVGGAGGGGGGGGVIILLYNTKAAGGTLSVAGGTGGAGVGGCTSGSSGSAGNIYNIQI